MQLKIPIIGILRGIDRQLLGPLMQASFAAGLQAMEVTMNRPGAAAMVAENCDQVDAGKYLGMGTIRNLAEAEKAYQAGAMFFVSPNLDPGVIEYDRSREIPVIAGALTPTEVYRAWQAGAAAVGVGMSLFCEQAVKAGDWDTVKKSGAVYRELQFRLKNMITGAGCWILDAGDWIKKFLLWMD